eukprot:1141304-Pelagomonas_calceolata.AAC.4
MLAFVSPEALFAGAGVASGALGDELFACEQTCTQAHAHAYTHTHTRANTHTRVHACTQTRVVQCDGLR